MLRSSLIALALASTAASAQPFETSWTTIDGGGGTVAGSGFEFCVTIGQHDAGPALTSGTLAAEPGYWPGIFASPPPCPADINGDGILDNGDIGTFVQAFLTGSPAADFNGDGFLDNGDIGSFVAAFLFGC